MIVVERPFFAAGAAVRVFDAGLSQAAGDLRSTLLRALNQDSSLAIRPCDKTVEGLLVAVSEGGEAVDSDAFDRAMALAQVLPSNVPPPEVVIETDGEVGFDWENGPRRVLSISIGPGPMLRYSALIGASPAYGRVVFGGVLPDILSFLLQALYGGRHNRA